MNKQIFIVFIAYNISKIR